MCSGYTHWLELMSLGLGGHMWPYFVEPELLRLTYFVAHPSPPYSLHFISAGMYRQPITCFRPRSSAIMMFTIYSMPSPCGPDENSFIFSWHVSYVLTCTVLFHSVFYFLVGCFLCVIVEHKFCIVA